MHSYGNFLVCGTNLNTINIIDSSNPYIEDPNAVHIPKSTAICSFFFQGYMYDANIIQKMQISGNIKLTGLRFSGDGMYVFASTKGINNENINSVLFDFEGVNEPSSAAGVYVWDSETRQQLSFFVHNQEHVVCAHITHSIYNYLIVKIQARSIGGMPIC